MELKNFQVVEVSGQLKATWDSLDPLLASCSIEYGVKVESMANYVITAQNEHILTEYEFDLFPCKTLKVLLLPIVKGKELEAHKVYFDVTPGNIIQLLINMCYFIFTCTSCYCYK